MAFHCDATNKYLSMAANANLYLTGQSWTMAGWINFDLATSVSDRWILTYGTLWGTNSLLMYVMASGGANPNKIRFWMKTDGGGWRESYTSDTSFASTGWQHLTFVQNNTNSRLYRNNVQKMDKWAAPTGENLDPALPLLWGKSSSSLDGQIAEWAAWDRVLPTAERQMLVDGRSPAFIPKTLNWHFKGIRALREERHGIVVTNNNACPVLPHPRIFYPHGIWVPPGAGGEVKEITGTVDAVATVSGDLHISRLLTGTVDAQSAVTGSIEVFKAITGTVDAAATVAGSIEVSRKLTGTIDAQAVVTGDLSASKLLTGTVACVSTIVGNLTVPVGGLSAYTELKILDHIVGKATYSKPTVAIGLCTADPGEAATGGSCNEVANTNGYGRVAVPDTDWNVAAGGEIDNANPIIFPEATGNWGEVTHYVLLDSAVYGQGNVLAFDELDLAKTIIDDEIVNFAAGQLKFALT